MKRVFVLLSALFCAGHLLLAQPAEQVAAERLKTISVSATGEVFAPPDRATVRLGAQAEAPDAASAQENVNETMEKVIARLKRAGVAEKDIRTSTLQLLPIYAPESSRVSQAPREGEITGYRAVNSVRVVVNDFSKIGAVIDAAMKGGANRIEGVSFELRQDLEARIQALDLALGEARAKAEAIARRMNVRIQSVHRISEGEDRVFPIESHMMMERAAFSGGTPVQPGEVRVEASVNVIYEIAQ